jgi:integrase
VFTYAGKPLANANTKAWRNALKRAGIENFRWHDIRTWASLRRQSGTPTHELQRLGGWRSSIMVERYAHLAPDHLAKAANRLDAAWWLRFRYVRARRDANPSKLGGPGWTRTSDQRIMSPLL